MKPESHKRSARDFIRIVSPTPVFVSRQSFPYCMPASWLEHQIVVVNQAVEPVTSEHCLRIDILEHEEKLMASYAGSLAADLTDKPDGLTLTRLAQLC